MFVWSCVLFHYFQLNHLGGKRVNKETGMRFRLQQYSTQRIYIWFNIINDPCLLCLLQRLPCYKACIWIVTCVHSLMYKLHQGVKSRITDLKQPGIKSSSEPKPNLKGSSEIGCLFIKSTQDFDQPVINVITHAKYSAVTREKYFPILTKDETCFMLCP